MPNHPSSAWWVRGVGVLGFLKRSNPNGWEQQLDSSVVGLMGFWNLNPFDSFDDMMFSSWRAQPPWTYEPKLTDTSSLWSLQDVEGKSCPKYPNCIKLCLFRKGPPTKVKACILIIWEPGEISFNQMDPIFFGQNKPLFLQIRISPSFEVCEEVDSIITSFTSWSLPWTMEGMYRGSQSIRWWNLDVFQLHLRESCF